MAENEKPEKTENEKPEKTENEKPAEKSAKKELDNFVFVGKKPAMSYVLAVVTQFTDGMSEVHIRARGKSISRAVDVAEIVKNRFVKDIKRDINIATEEIEDKEKNSRINVSTINITLKK